MSKTPNLYSSTSSLKNTKKIRIKPVEKVSLMESIGDFSQNLNSLEKAFNKALEQYSIVSLNNY